MKSKHDAPPGRPEAPPALTGAAAVPVSFLGPLLAEFPEPVVVTNSQHKVVFLNCAAQKLFGESLRPGAPCPICAENAIIEGTGQEASRPEPCPQLGESYRQVPVLLKTRWPLGAPLSLSATPIRDTDRQKAGCFILIRESTDLLAHPAMEQQMATLSSILENFPIPFFMVDPFLMVTHLNERMEKLSGYTRSEVVGRMTCGELLNTVQCNTADCVLKQVMLHKKAFSGERRVVRTRHGREVPVTVYASIITDPEGRVIGGFEAVRDITPIVEAERKLDLITELTQEGMLMADENQRIIFANTKMAEIVGRARDELVGKSLEEILTAQHQKMAMELIRMEEQGRQEEVQFCTTLNGTYVSPEKNRVFETCMAASRIGNNILTCIYLRDLTQRIRMHEQLKKTNIFLNNIIRCSVDGIVVIDTKGSPLIFSEGAERILGYQAGEIIADRKRLHRFYPLQLAREMMRRMRSDEYGPPDRLNTTEITFYNKDGEEVPVRFSAAIIRDKGQEVGSVGIFSDLREHRRMQKKLEETQNQLLQAEKIASLGQLAAGVAHEINNPLAGILIYAQILQREMEEDDAGRQHLKEIISQTLRCKEIVTRLLEFSRRSLGQRNLVDVNDVILRCVKLIDKQVLFHNIEIKLELDPDLPQIFADPGELQQVFTNLFINAADAMKGWGTITITSHTAPQKDGLIITFSDTGSGIPPEIRDKIFDPFFTTKPPGKGTGLGLSVVYGVIQRHGGSIEVECPPGGGITFTIRLPLESQEIPEQMDSE
jgi:PAS domain S-box-containing protein